MAPIQVDYDGVYFEYPNGIRKMDGNIKSVADFEEEKRNILRGAISGDLRAVEILKTRYRIKCFIHKGKRII